MRIIKWIAMVLLGLVAMLVLAAYLGYASLIVGVVSLSIALSFLKKTRIPLLYGLAIILVLSLVTKKWAAPWVDQQLRTHARLTYKVVKDWPILQDLLTAKAHYYPGLDQEVHLFQALAVADSVDGVQIKKQADQLTQKMRDQGFLSDSEWVEFDRLSNLIRNHQSKMKKFISPNASGAEGDEVISVVDTMITLSVPSYSEEGVEVPVSLSAVVRINVSGVVNIGRGDVGPEGESGYWDYSMDSSNLATHVGGCELIVGGTVQDGHIIGGQRYLIGSLWEGTLSQPARLRVVESRHGYHDGNTGAFTAVVTVL